MSGNSIGDRVKADVWLGEFTGLRLGEVPALRVPMCGVRVTDDDLCFGMVRRLEVKGPFGYDPWLELL